MIFPLQNKHDLQAESAVQLGNGRLTLEEVVAVARFGRAVAPFGPDMGDAAAAAAYGRAVRSREWVEAVVAKNDRAYYGINTGFGIKAGRIPLEREDIPWISRNLIVSHATGVGPMLHPEIVRAALLIRANSLAQGYSGVRLELINTLVAMLNAGVTPVVPEEGSVGSSGDLAPLSHVAQVVSARPPTDDPDKLLGDDIDPAYDESGQALVVLRPGETAERVVEIDDRRYAQLSGAAAMEKCGIPQLVLTAKEGLGLNNGATFSAAIAVLALVDAENLARHAEIGAALALEALLGFRDAFLPHIQQVRRQAGQGVTAARVLRFLAGSTLADGDVDRDPNTLPPQDDYSLRTVPQTLGAVWDTLGFVREILNREVNAATDNPMIFVGEEGDDLMLARPYKTISGGNFHGTPIGYAMDFLSIVMTDLGSMSERRIYRLTNHKTNHGLPSMLVEERAFGQTSGMMIPQYLASALVSACKTLAHPDSVDSIPTSAGREDFVSMSMNAALHARQVVGKIEKVVAIELLCGYLGVSWRLQALAQALEDKNFVPEDVALAERTRADECLVFLRRVGLRPQAGVGSQAALSEIESALYADGRKLPDLGKQPATIDRFSQPYIYRMAELVQSGAVVNAVYAAAAQS